MKEVRVQFGPVKFTRGVCDFTPAPPCPLSPEARERLKILFKAGHERIESFAEHWIHGVNRDYDEAESYCFSCAEKRIAELEAKDPEGEWIVDGGWGRESETTPFCEDCKSLLMLYNTLTDHGCEMEVEHFLEYGFDPDCDDDCRSMWEVIASRGWELRHFPFDRKRDREERVRYFKDLHRLAHSILLWLDHAELLLDDLAASHTPG